MSGKLPVTYSHSLARRATVAHANRLTIELQAGAQDETMYRIMQSIEAGELGRMGFAP